MYAQFGDDDWILQQFPAGYTGNAIEVGAHDGRDISNTLLLEEKGWKVLCVEPNPDSFIKCRQNRKLTRRLACGIRPAYNQPFYIHDALVSSYSSLNQDLWYTYPDAKPTPGTTICAVDVETLDTLVEQHDMAPLDVLSVDTEGTEEDVLLGLTIEKPRIVILESWYPDSPALRLMQSRGYKLAHTVSHNYWFTL